MEAGYHNIYEVTPSLFAMKDKIEDHLCRRTDDLFNLNNRLERKDQEGLRNKRR